jgi:hypothetical protein
MADEPIWLATKELVLGWQVTKTLEPQHWDKQGAKPGGHKPTDLVTAVPKTIAHHTVIIAQSGSGKSFFLGRLLEEILLKTRSRVLVLDQNSDFRKAAEAKTEEHWTNPDKWYNHENRIGFLPDEQTQADFAARWDAISKRLYAGVHQPKFECTPLRLDWLRFPVELLAEEAAEKDRDQLRHCHRFVSLAAVLAKATEKAEWLKEGAFLGCADSLCQDTPSGVEVQIIEELRKRFGLVGGQQQGAKSLTDTRGTVYFTLPPFTPTISPPPTLRGQITVEDIEVICQQAATHRRFVLPDAVRFYFSRAFELERAGVVDPNIHETMERPDTRRLEVVDLPSIVDVRHQKMAMCTFLEAEWQRARLEWEEALGQPTAEDDKRVPTFIVVEEAHNAVPADAETPTEKKLQEQFRRIAAEGRKYGLFLILVSQRPDKLDRMVMSECENRAVMRVGSSFILRRTCEVLGLDGVVPRMTDKVLDFDLGRALLVGPWVADEPAFLVSAARRTEEGGRNLRWQHWAKPEEHLGSDAAEAPQA